MGADIRAATAHHGRASKDVVARSAGRSPTSPQLAGTREVFHAYPALIPLSLASRCRGHLRMPTGRRERAGNWPLKSDQVARFDALLHEIHPDAPRVDADRISQLARWLLAHARGRGPRRARRAPGPDRPIARDDRRPRLGLRRGRLRARAQAARLPGPDRQPDPGPRPAARQARRRRCCWNWRGRRWPPKPRNTTTSAAIATASIRSATARPSAPPGSATGSPRWRCVQPPHARQRKPLRRKRPTGRRRSASAAEPRGRHAPCGSARGCAAVTRQPWRQRRAVHVKPCLRQGWPAYPAV